MLTEGVRRACLSDVLDVYWVEARPIELLKSILGSPASPVRWSLGRRHNARHKWDRVTARRCD